jgi:oligopeptide/dipeptide ABC transporter ATP-binding protein
MTMAARSRAALQVDYLKKEFAVSTSGGKRMLTAVESLDLKIAPGETVALVGESGSGKSTAARCIVQLLEPTAGFVTIDGQSVSSLPQARRSSIYKNIQLVFQDPNASLDPRWPVAKILEEPLRHHFSLTKSERTGRVAAIMGEVGLGLELLDRRSRQLSGGQRQRVGIARALMVEPKVIILDEPTASLDVSVRGQVLRLLRRIQQDRQVAYLFISHDLQVVRHVANRVIVMYLGAVLESGPIEKVFASPAHPYTQALVGASPMPSYRGQVRTLRLEGEIPSPIDRPSGCLLVGRCPLAVDACSRDRPTLVDLGGGWSSACPITAADRTGTSVPPPPIANQ